MKARIKVLGGVVCALAIASAPTWPQEAVAWMGCRMPDRTPEAGTCTRPVEAK